VFGEVNNFVETVVGCLVSGRSGHVENCRNSTVRGYQNVLKNSNASSIIGAKNLAEFNYCELRGENLIANAEYSKLLGRFNEVNADVIFAYGNGSAEDARSNLFEFYKNGLVVIPALETSTITNPKALTTKEYVDGSAGTTADRPVSPKIGHYYFDTDINKPIWFNGTDYTDSAGTIV
jgi:hypothetical protein